MNIEILPTCIDIAERAGEEVDFKYIVALKTTDFLFASEDTFISFHKMHGDHYQMHIVSAVGGADIHRLIRPSIREVLELGECKSIIGFVPDRKLRLLIGCMKGPRPVKVLEDGTAVYIVTKEDKI